MHSFGNNKCIFQQIDLRHIKYASFYKYIKKVMSIIQTSRACLICRRHAIKKIVTEGIIHTMEICVYIHVDGSLKAAFKSFKNKVSK